MAILWRRPQICSAPSRRFSLRLFSKHSPTAWTLRLGREQSAFRGGERQRLAIVRSLLRESAALILDEATSALDGPTECAVFASLAELRPHQTLIVSSHHISSLTWVDRFALLDQGRIAATGDHTMLYAQSVLYRTLFDASAHDGP